MCGIVGAYNWGNTSSLEAMNRVQAHRGPDDAGLWEGGAQNGDWLGLGSRRLSILDLSPAGHMPMFSPDQKITIVYNGEVYNFLELREELQSKGYQFRSGSDTEVIIAMYREYGLDSIRRLNGMFALALWDSEKQQLVLARDHFGIKPLYYIHRGSKFAFASEVKSLMQLPDFTPQVDRQGLHRYLTFTYLPDPTTMFEEVQKIPAGCYGVYKQGEFKITQYWDMQYPDANHKFETSEEALIEELRNRLKKSIKMQMVSDVPIGAFLSAGIDSSSIVAVMAEYSEYPVQTFTITIPEYLKQGEVAFDDTEVAKNTARYFGCTHTEIEVDPKIAEILPQMAYHLDDPIADASMITTYMITKETRKNVTVALSGLGGDELFAGYRKYWSIFLRSYYQAIPAPLRKYLIEPGINALPMMKNTPFKGYVDLAKKLARSGSLPEREGFLKYWEFFDSDEKHRLYNPAIREEMFKYDTWAFHQRAFDNVDNASLLNQMLYIDTRTYMLGLALPISDKMSMANSLEVRVPFLDWEFADWVAQNIPPGLKLKGRTTKHILKKAVESLLPPEVMTQRKTGFSIPLYTWLAKDLRPMVDDLLGETTLKKRGFFDPQTVQKMLTDHRSARHDYSRQIFQLLMLELWMQAFIDQPSQAGHSHTDHLPEQARLPVKSV